MKRGAASFLAPRSCPYQRSAPSGSRWSTSIPWPWSAPPEVVVPLKPDVYGVQTAGRLTITFELHSAHAIRDFEVGQDVSAANSRAHAQPGARGFSGSNVELKEDFAVRYALDPAQADSLRVIAERESPREPGFFQAQALLGIPPARTAAAHPARAIVVLFDDSLSMQWEKLERSFHALESLLRSLRPADSFNLLAFNEQVTPFSPAPVAASTDSVEKALAFLRAERLRGRNQPASGAGCGALADVRV